MLLLTGIINTRGHYARQKFYVCNQLPVSIRIFHPSTWLSDQRNKNAYDSRLNVVLDIVLIQGIRDQIVIKLESSNSMEENCNKA